jgi:hypothetical protein
VLGKFFHSLLVPCGASLDITFPDVTDFRKKKEIRGSLIF